MEATSERAPATIPRRQERGLAVARLNRSTALARELRADTRVRSVKGLDVHSVTADDAPRVMEEIGRVRETEFRKEGGGTGRPEDIDRFDLGSIPYRQLVVWDAQQQELVSAYRYILCRDTLRCGLRPALATEELFEYFDDFSTNYLPYSIELGRSVVNRQARRSFLGLFAAWAGLGALVREYPEIRYFFGKVTMYPTYDVAARDALLHFLRLHCPDPDTLVRPRTDLEVVPAGTELDSLFRGDDYDTDYAILRTKLKALGEVIPPLMISYLGVTHTMKTFGTARNYEFGDVDETAILITIRDIDQETRTRFIDSYRRICPGIFCSGPDDCGSA